MFSSVNYVALYVMYKHVGTVTMVKVKRKHLIHEILSSLCNYVDIEFYETVRCDSLGTPITREYVELVLLCRICFVVLEMGRYLLLVFVNKGLRSSSPRGSATNKPSKKVNNTLIFSKKGLDNL